MEGFPKHAQGINIERIANALEKIAMYLEPEIHENKQPEIKDTLEREIESRRWPYANNAENPWQMMLLFAIIVTL